jgi:glycosyltransferase involved in cell wall biosynthesis
MKIISFIIPVYQVEKYIGKCIDSIYRQMIPEDKFEVIVINDGTPDNSMEIARKFASKHSNIKFIEQQNQGLSVARNKGFKAATGEYIWFVDSDDYLMDHSIKEVSDIIQLKNVDIIVTLLNRVKEDTGVALVEKYPETLSLNKGDGIMAGKDYLFNKGEQGATQRFIIRRNFLVLHKLEFMPGILHEDAEFGPRLLYLANSVYLKETPVYNYLLRSKGSIMSSRSIKNSECIILSFDSLMVFCETTVESKDKLMFKAKAYHILLLSIGLGQVFWKSKEFKEFYSKNKSIIKKNAWALRGDCDFSLKNFFYILWYRIAPLNCEKFRHYLAERHK